MGMNTKVITGGIIVIVIIIGIIYFMSRGSAAPATAPATATTSTSQAATPSVTTNASSSDQVQGQDVAIGTGAQATPGSIVSVLYVGKLPDGTVFDSSAAHGNTPLTFALGTNGLIPGFQIGINGMKVGGERLLQIPPSLGYGDKPVTDPTTGKVVIPANSTLIFDVKLVSVKPGSTTPATATTPAK